MVGRKSFLTGLAATLNDLATTNVSAETIASMEEKPWAA
jgi:hypothetical protein